MGKVLAKAYERALDTLNLRRVAEWTGRGYSTLQAYRLGTRPVTPAAARELVAYLRYQAESFTEAADRLEAALAEEDRKNG